MLGPIRLVLFWRLSKHVEKIVKNNGQWCIGRRSERLEVETPIAPQRLYGAVPDALQALYLFRADAAYLGNLRGCAILEQQLHIDHPRSNGVQDFTFVLLS